MLATAFVQLVIALYLLIFSQGVENLVFRRCLEVGVTIQYFISMALVTIWLMY